MFRTVPLKPKHQKKLSKSGQSAIGFDVPDRWVDFANLCIIRSGTKYINFVPFWYQSKIIEAIEQRKFTAIAKTRQLGISELLCNWFVWKALRNPAYVAVILSKNQTDTSALAKRVKKQLFPFVSKGWLQFETDNLQDISIGGGGRLLFRNSSPNGIRGVESVSDCLFDEWGFVSDAPLIYEAVLPTLELVGDEARVIVNSTPNGRTGHYWDLISSGNGSHDLLGVCKDIREGVIEPYQEWTDSSGWNKIVLHWKAHPIYSQIPDYLERKRSENKMSETGIQREYNLSFDDSELNVFPYELIERAAIGEYSPPSADRRYYMGIDTSSIGDDYFVGYVLGEKNGRYDTPAIYRQRKASMERNLGAIGDLIEKYNPVKVGVETNHVGALYLEKLTMMFPATVFVPIKTTQESKPIMIERSVHAHERGVIEYPTGIISDEHKSFVRNNGKMEASGTSHDDTVMALCFALAVSPFGTNKRLLDIPTFERVNT